MPKSNKFKWPENVSFTHDADNDFAALDNTQRLVVFKAIKKVASNPKPRPGNYPDAVRLNFVIMAYALSINWCHLIPKI